MKSLETAGFMLVMSGALGGWDTTRISSPEGSGEIFVEEEEEGSGKGE